MSTRYSWNKQATPQELHAMLDILKDDYLIIENGVGYLLNFKQHDKGLKIQFNDNSADIYYENITYAARALGTVFSMQKKTEREIEELLPFNTFGVLLDCSRNAVLKVDYVKKWLKRLALMGYNMVMLYTKDTYKLPGEDYFGYLRGSYTINELREIDDYASKLGIEMIGSIQALGHLEPVLRWPAYGHIKDTPSVLLTSEKKTYELINKMLDFYSTAFKSRRIHLGMDETHDLGRGSYMDLNGYKPGFDIFNEHLVKVNARCQQMGLSPMIWSDMYFRLGSKTLNYYDQESSIPADVKNEIPKDVKLVYWDYWHKDESFYREWIVRHKKLGFTPVMASAVHVCRCLWYNHQRTMNAVSPCIDACKKENVKEIFFCTWGDDGIFFDYDSALAGFCYTAEKAYTADTCPDKNNIARRFKAVCNGNYTDHITASAITSENISALDLLWDDFLLGIYWKNQKQISKEFWHTIHKEYSKIESKLIKSPHGNAGDVKRILILIKILKKKIKLKLDLDAAYSSSNKEQLKKVKDMIPGLIKDFDKLIKVFRLHWNARYKSFGFEIACIRFGGQKERLKELSIRLEEYLVNNKPIPELTETAHYMEPWLSNINLFSNLSTGTHFV